MCVTCADDDNLLKADPLAEAEVFDASLLTSVFVIVLLCFDANGHEFVGRQAFATHDVRAATKCSMHVKEPHGLHTLECRLIRLHHPVLTIRHRPARCLRTELPYGTSHQTRTEAHLKSRRILCVALVRVWVLIVNPVYSIGRPRLNRTASFATSAVHAYRSRSHFQRRKIGHLTAATNW